MVLSSFPWIPDTGRLIHRSHIFLAVRQLLRLEAWSSPATGTEHTCTVYSIEIASQGT